MKIYRRNSTLAELKNSVSEQNKTISKNQIVSEMVSTMFDDRCCGHCKYYDGKGYCSDGKPVRPTDYCSSFKYA